MNWTKKRALVTGGASFIGSTLVDQLLDRGATVRVVDNLTSGHLDNIDRNHVEFREADLLEPGVARNAAKGMDVVFHLAADHGGRGYVDLHQAECSTNFMLDGMVFREAHRAGVEKIVFASSGCVYPNFKQADPKEILYLTEETVGPPYDADNLYGWAKLMAEETLRAYHKAYGIKTANCRYFTVFGPRGIENHAVIAMIARSFIRQNPFEVWGTGEQIRNWTYVDDIVRGTILAAEKIDDGTPVNLGTMERTRVIDAVHMIMKDMGHDAEIKLLPNMPTGPYNRVCDNSRAKELLGWEPEVNFREGVRRTIEWYRRNKTPQQVSSILSHMLTERAGSKGAPKKVRATA